jgi:hypothetical protein
MTNRTSNGNVTESAREKYGNKKGKFPIFDVHSALSAIKLRGHSPDPAEVLRRVAAWARAHNKPKVLAAVEAARKHDAAK